MGFAEEILLGSEKNSVLAYWVNIFPILVKVYLYFNSINFYSYESK